MSSANATQPKAWHIPASDVSRQTVNPIRRIVDRGTTAPNPEKAVISLALGDPTVFGNFKTDETVMQAVADAVKDSKSHGYAPAAGHLEARAAIAAYHSLPSASLTPNDIFIASGCSGALEIVIGSLFNEGDNILLPSPGFSLYETLATSKNIECRFYSLLPDKNWEADMSELEGMVDGRTRGIIVNNPSNPCGSVYSKEHLLEILEFCERKRVPVIADEIYSDMTFDEHVFYPMASLTNTVPILSVGGLAKKWLVPGWRVGWICIYDRGNAFAEIRPAFDAMSGIVLGSNTIVQRALPTILSRTPGAFYRSTINGVEKNARLCAELAGAIPGLKVIQPQGAMYMMIGVDPLISQDEVEFCQQLLAQQSVMVLPGSCFNYPGYFRIVVTPPEDKLREAFGRISEYVASLRKE